MAENRNIVILGASFGGLATAHYICKHVLPRLQKVADAKYTLHLVDSSSHFWWQIGAPREIVSVEQAKHEKYFVPVMDGFKQYSNLKDSIVFHHGTVDAVDTQSRSVTIKTQEENSELLPYYALVIATGVRSPTPLTTLHGDYTISQRALEKVNAQLTTAKEVIISGGGPVGVEIAGEIGVHLKGKAKVTLITGSDKLLPVLSASRAAKAQKLLTKVGVDVLYNTKVTSSNETAEGKMEVVLADGTTRVADVYIPAYGVTPNTAFLPDSLKAESGYVKTNPTTLRVDEAGPRVYAAGDVAGVDKGGVLNMFATIPILGANIAHDLLTEAKVGGAVPAAKEYVYKPAETQVVPVGPKTGVGAFNGFGMPGFMVSLVKGKDYMVGNMSQFTEGTKFVKA